MTYSETLELSLLMVLMGFTIILFVAIKQHQTINEYIKYLKSKGMPLKREESFNFIDKNKADILLDHPNIL